jgi:hypothetical protein
MKRILILALLALLIAGINTGLTEVRSRQEPGINYFGLSTDTKPTDTSGNAEVKPGSKFTETDTGIIYLWSGSAWGLPGAGGGGGIAPVTADQDSLVAPGTTTALSMTGFSSAAYYLDISSIDTDITFQMEVRNANADGWTNLNVTGDASTADLDGTWSIRSTALAPDDSVRVNWLTESGGTGAVVLFNSERW